MLFSIGRRHSLVYITDAWNCEKIFGKPETLVLLERIFPPSRCAVPANPMQYIVLSRVGELGVLMMFSIAAAPWPG